MERFTLKSEPLNVPQMLELERELRPYLDIMSQVKSTATLRVISPDQPAELVFTAEQEKIILGCEFCIRYIFEKFYGDVPKFSGVALKPAGDEVFDSKTLRADVYLPFGSPFQVTGQ